MSELNNQTPPDAKDFRNPRRQGSGLLIERFVIPEAIGFEMIDYVQEARQLQILRNKVIVFIGTGDIATVSALEVAADGGTVVVASRAKKDNSHDEELVGNLKKLGSKDSFHIPADFKIEEDRKKILNEAAKVSDRVDGVVVTPGVSANGNFARVKEKKFREDHDINLFAPVYMGQAALDQMSRRNKPAGGNIVMLSSIVSAGHGGHIEYAVAKAGEDAFARSAAEEYPDLFVNTINPAYVDTKMLGSIKEEDLSALVASTGADRVLLRGEVAALISFLLSDRMKASGLSISLLGVGGFPPVDKLGLLRA